MFGRCLGRTEGNGLLAGLGIGSDQERNHRGNNCYVDRPAQPRLGFGSAVLPYRHDRTPLENGFRKVSCG
jgi:hypothetical protein